MTRYFAATAKTGETVVRCTAHRVYTHACIGTGYMGFAAAAWAGSYALAVKRAAKRGLEIAEAREITAKEYRAYAAAARAAWAAVKVERLDADGWTGKRADTAYIG